MGRFILRRSLLIILVLFLVSVIVFLITSIIPGDPAQAILGQSATPEALHAVRHQLGLDQPAILRYFSWLGNLLRGNLGESLTFQVPIGPLLLSKLGNSAILAGAALLFTVPISLLLGVIAGLTKNRWPDTTISLITLAGVAQPEFVTGTFLIAIFATWLHWLPATNTFDTSIGFWPMVQSFIMPVVTLSLVLLAYIGRMTRTSVIDVMETDYVRTAILKGMPYRTVVLRHALRNALLPSITIIASNVGWLLGGIVVTESLFGYPGLGRLLLQAVQGRDVPMLQDITLLIALVFSLSNLAADVLYALLNPRVRLA
ncbi:MAG: ABC-type dipeptide/oligopeptide/nickel transport system, permease component [Chloroflexi bacterium]|nr:ABC-type dipeptide/oligopeptide/nickel transport system, permease component [Chloroflexota bacterium]